MAEPFEFDREWNFPVSRDEFWATILRVDDYTSWWRWLRRFDADGLYAGAHADCTIQAPLPFALSFAIDVEDVIEGDRVDTWISGDLEGPARLELRTLPEGCAARLVWTLDLHHRLVLPLAVVARPALVWSHDQVVKVGLSAFERNALGRTD